MREMRREPEVPEEEVPAGECIDGLARITTCCVQLIKYTTIGFRLSGYGAAEVFIDFAEELKHKETNPMCSTLQSRRTSC